MRLSLAHWSIIVAGVLATTVAAGAEWTPRRLTPPAGARPIEEANRRPWGYSAAGLALVENPNPTRGAPPLAVVDRYGALRHLVEPTEGVELSGRIGGPVEVLDDTGETLLASQLAFPDPSPEAPANPIALASHQAPLFTEPVMLDALVAPTPAPLLFYAGGELLYVRAGLAGPVGYAAVDTSLPDATTTQLGRFGFSHDGSFRAFAGAQDPGCGAEVRFTYSQLESDAGLRSPEASATLAVRPPPTVGAIITGDTVVGSASVRLEDFDLAFTKILGASDCSPLAGPAPGCGDPCGPSCLPWDVAWTGAVRFASLDASTRVTAETTSTANPNPGVSNAASGFEGVGLRTGLLGRLGVGSSDAVSVFLKGDVSLLVGDLSRSYSSQALGEVRSTVVTVVPVTELEAGVALMLNDHAQLSGGYMMAVWHGVGPAYEAPAGLGVDPGADSVTFDGAFLRGELGW